MFALTVGVGAINVGYSAEVTGLNDELASIIELDADKQGVWSANKNTISGSVTTKKEEGGCFDDATYTSDSSTLTLTYTGTEEGYLSFNFTLVAGKRVTLDEREYTSDVGEETSFKKSMNANNNKLLIHIYSKNDLYFQLFHCFSQSKKFLCLKRQITHNIVFRLTAKK